MGADRRGGVRDREPEHAAPADHRELHIQIATYLKAHGGGEVLLAPYDVVLSQGDVLQPDLVYVAGDDRDVLTDANIWGTPSWAIEVLSPSDPARDRKLKLQRYERFGVPGYWIVDPAAEAVEVYRLDAGAYGSPAILTPCDVLSPVRPNGLEVDLGQIFAR